MKEDSARSRRTTHPSGEPPLLPAGQVVGEHEVRAPEPDTRYAMLRADFQASRQADPYSPTAPTLIARRFDENRELPEARVRKMFEDVLTSPLVPRVAKSIETGSRSK